MVAPRAGGAERALLAVKAGRALVVRAALTARVWGAAPRAERAERAVGALLAMGAVKARVLGIPVVTRAGTVTGAATAWLPHIDPGKGRRCPPHRKLRGCNMCNMQDDTQPTQGSQQQCGIACTARTKRELQGLFGTILRLV